ncbi:MAG: heavy metal-binding domain-containing protein [Lachnospiraceae bacterium]|nr:heavy metal-binding domain-containing protein [Lachnospiraceae bacterium]
MSSKGYREKLEKAKEYAITDLKKRAFRAGGNAIIGTSLSITTFNRDVIGIVVTGTVVEIEPADNNQRSE